MEIQFLGTSSGVPTKARNVSGLSIRAAGSKHWHLVDCGEGTQHRILHTNLSLAKLAAIFITHVHGDHCYGLPGLLASAGMQKRTDPLRIAGPSGVRRFLQGVLETTLLRLPYSVDFIDVEVTPGIEMFDDFRVQVTALSHRVPSFAYSFSEKSVERRLDVAKLDADSVQRGPGWGRIQQALDVTTPDGRAIRAADYLLPSRKPRKVIVGGDNDTPSLLREEAATADVLIHEATYTAEVLQKVGPEPQHSAARDVARFAEEARVRNLVLTHFSPRYQEQEGGTSLAALEAEARAEYSGKLFLANDLERYVLDKEGLLSRVG